MATGDPASEIALPVDQLISLLTDSFASAAENLRKKMAGPAWADSPYIYHMPGMIVEVRLALSYSDQKVKGIFNKAKSETSQEMSSSIRVELVSVPNPAKASPNP